MSVYPTFRLNNLILNNLHICNQLVMLSAFPNHCSDTDYLEKICTQKNPLHRLHQHLDQLFTNYIRIKPIDVFFHFQIKSNQTHFKSSRFKLNFNSTKTTELRLILPNRPTTNGISRNSPNSLESMARNQVYSSLIYS